MKEERCCGTCRYWLIKGQPLGLGKCKYNDKVRHQDEMKTCLGWKVRK